MELKEATGPKVHASLTVHLQGESRLLPDAFSITTHSQPMSSISRPPFWTLVIGKGVLLICLLKKYCLL